MPPAMKKAIAAKLVDHFKVSMDALAKLTDRQIRDIYFHKRDKDGEIEMEAVERSHRSTFERRDPNEITAVEEETPTLESELRNLDILAAAVRMDPVAVEQAREKLRAKFAAMNEG